MKFPDPARPPDRPLTPGQRRRAIAAVLEARFSLSAFEASRSDDPVYWASPRNGMARGIYDEALRERVRLDAAEDRVLLAELRYLDLWERSAGTGLTLARVVRPPAAP